MKPHVTLKLATSLDGRIAAANGDSRWITGEAARAVVHDLRARSDAVLTGIGSVLADDPELTARTAPPPRAQPLRVVLDTRWRTPPGGRLGQTLSLGPVLVLGAGDCADEARRDALRDAGFQIAIMPRAAARVDVAAALIYLAKDKGVRRLLAEAGGAVAASLVAGDHVDALEWFRAPLLLGAAGAPVLQPLPQDSLAGAPRFTRIDVQTCGADIWERYERAQTCSPAS